MSDLKPCPCKVCGSENYAIQRTWNRRKEKPTIVWFVYCDDEDCGVQSPNRATRDEAVAAWNELHRPDSLALTAAVQAEREACARICDDMECRDPGAFGDGYSAACNEIQTTIMARSRGPAPAVQAEMRPEVRAFALLMEAQLRANDHKPGWKKDRALDLRRRLGEEASELDRAIEETVDALTVPLDNQEFAAARVRLRNNVAKEAADVANFAMMIADVCGGLDVRPAPAVDVMAVVREYVEAKDALQLCDRETVARANAAESALRALVSPTTGEGKENK